MATLTPTPAECWMNSSSVSHLNDGITVHKTLPNSPKIKLQTIYFHILFLILIIDNFLNYPSIGKVQETLIFVVNRLKELIFLTYV